MNDSKASLPDSFNVGSVEICMLDVIEQSVAPVKPIPFVIHRKTVGPSEQNVSEDLNVGAVRIGARDVGGPVPLWEEDVAFVWVNDNSSGSLQILQKGSPVGNVSGAQHVQGSLPAVDVVEVLGSPVDGQAFYSFVLWGQDVFAGGSVFLDSVDHVQDDVWVVDVVPVGVEVESDESGRARDDGYHRVGEARRNWTHDLSLDELLLWVHEEVVDVLAALEVGPELEADLAGALVPQLSFDGQSVFLGGGDDTEVFAVVALGARVVDVGLEKFVNHAQSFWLLALKESQ